MRDGFVDRSRGRRVAFTDFGTAGDDAVLWCHGGPGSRREPRYVAGAAGFSGLRLIGVDRPGYGGSDPQPGRTIADWVPDALAVMDELRIDRFFVVGVSTGGAYALAAAALAPDRVRGVIACASITDMRDPDARATMSRSHAHAVWDAPDRDAAIAAAVRSHGHDGGQIIASAAGPPLARSDLAMLTSRWGELWVEDVPNVFAHGLEGYADDRIADGPGWTSFDVGAIRCPVIVLHGAEDRIADVVHARRNAAIVPGAELRLVDGLGHFSIQDELVPALTELRALAHD